MQITFKVLQKALNQGISKKSWKTLNKRPLQMTGLKVRRKMLDLIKRVGDNSPSKPGSPPHAHRATGYRGKDDFKKIYSVPALAGAVELVGHEGLGQRQTPMEIQEFGQRVKILAYKRSKKKARSKKQADQARRLFLAGKIENQKKEIITVKMPERRFAGKALDIERKRLPAFWANSVSAVHNTI